MRIECQACNTRFKLDDDLIKKDGTKVRCSKCKEVITVYPQKKNEGASRPESKPSQSSPAPKEQEEQSAPSQDSDIPVSKDKSKQSAPRLLILLALLGIVCTGGITYYFHYLDIYAVGILFCFFCAFLWPQLKNIFASIWLKIDPPFQQGELICVENQVQGYVIQSNYSITRLRTDTSAIVSIPNSILIHNKIVNYSIHPESFPLSCDVQVDIQNSPDRVRKILLDAALPVKGVSSNHEPYTSLHGLSGNGYSHYSLFFYLEDIDKKIRILEEIWDRIWKLFKRAGILPYIPVQTEEEDSLESILDEIDIFKPFTDYAKSYMSKNMNRCHFEPGAFVFNQGDEGNSLFIIEEGVIGVQVEITPGKCIEVARLGAGSFFGEMALLTGEARTANIVAISDTVLFEITREHIAPLIDEQPQISTSLSELLVQRKIATEAEKNKYRAEKINRKALKKQIMDQIDTYFKEYNKTAYS
jgi:branched-chain amino acid transport system substrate-binding protein